MRRKSLLNLAIALFCSSYLAGCGNNDSEVQASSASSTSSSSETSETTSSTTPVSGTAVSVAPTSPKRFLTDAKALHVDGKDVLQFTFGERVPGYTAQYVTPPITDEGEGKAIAISGDNVIKLVFESSETIDLSNGSKKYYTGPDRITPTDTSVVSEVVKVSEYEGRLEFGIGTRTKAPFTITTATNIVTVTFS